MKKLLAVLVISGILAGLLSGCLAPPPEPAKSSTTPPPANTTDSSGTTDTEPAATGADTTASASPKESSDPQALVNGLSENGYWIFSLLADVTLNETLYVDGVFYNRDDTSGKVYRKLALNTQDASYKVIDRFTLTVPEMIINSPNFLIQNGTIKGNVHVNAEGLNLTGVDIEGTLTFETQALMDSANLEKVGNVSGGISVAGGTTAAEVVAEPEPEVVPEPEPEVATTEPAPSTTEATATPKPTATPKADTATPAPTATPTSAPTATPKPTPTPAPAADAETEASEPWEE